MKKSKLFKSMLIVTLFSVLLFSVTGCGMKSSVKEETSYENLTSGAAPMEQEQKTETQNSVVDKEKTDSVMDTNQSDRKIIQNKFYLIETLEFDTTITAIESLVSKYFGYVGSAEITGKEIYNTYSYNSRYAYYTFRIPSDKLNSFTQELEGLGNVVQERGNKEDVTTQYFDVTARIKSLKVQEERLLELVKKGTDLKDILEIEKQLSDVRYQIETYTATMINLDNQVNYSTVQVELKEVIEVSEYEEPAVTVGQRISKGFLDSIDQIKEFFVNLFIFVVVAIPYLIIWAVVIGSLIMIYKKVKTYRKRKKSKNEVGSLPEVKSEQSENASNNSEDI